MRWKTNWWGSQILSETEDERLLLEKLVASLPEKPEDGYDEGEIRVIKDSGKICDEWLLSDDEITESNIMIEIVR